MTDITIRYAESDNDVVAIHRFLCVVAGPMLPGPIDHKDSAVEVWRVVNHDVALMAMRDGLLVGTMGIVAPKQWWNEKLSFLANRWLFVIPGSRSFKPMLKEAVAIAKASDLELHIIDEQRERLSIFNKKERPDVLRR